MSGTILSSNDRVEISTRLREIKKSTLRELRNGLTKQAREDACKEISAFRQNIFEYDASVRSGGGTELLSATGVAMSVVSPFFLFAGPVAAIAGFALTIAGPFIAVTGWIVNEDRELKLGWIRRMLNEIYELSLLLRCGDFT
jgi:hypothetical protein